MRDDCWEAPSWSVSPGSGAFQGSNHTVQTVMLVGSIEIEAEANEGTKQPHPRGSHQGNIESEPQVRVTLHYLPGQPDPQRDLENQLQHQEGEQVPHRGLASDTKPNGEEQGHHQMESQDLS